ncbi:hypothetical protein EST38_g915 [Candolleomyces aberdarensis]|uniref:GH16 domain-containing protein n=1 Tax=Candolleomyces aberdarensis TaxID=2316362 RepID=A0A4Q2DYY4_9AGAR|nr:hypothetical protein EST38_g915 [Candolleomyces aberdarensis]
MLFTGYPVLTHFLTPVLTNQGGFNLGGINATGQIPDMVGNYGLIDRDTPKEALTKISYETGEEMVLVFSDEFNTDGRTFFPGDDPYWEAVDLWYWGTLDLEWYDPGQVTTKDGALQIKIEKVDDPATNHNMTYKSGMVQSWNKFCFTGGLIEASVRLPGSNSVGYVVLWTLGNLGRAGYGASLEGLWPYSYDTCDVGTLPNQTYPDGEGPLAAITNGDRYHGNVLSYLPGQRLSACTCPGESHPGPMRPDGSYVGRAAPEIDIIEALVEEGQGQVSQSSQWAPFNAQYRWHNTSDSYKIYPDPVSQTVLNPYRGGVFQQAVSGLSWTNQSCYELADGCFTTFGFEYVPGFDDAYITWVNNGNLAWTHYGRGLDTDTAAEIGPRPISQEPMYIIANLGISHGFGTLDETLLFPATMSIDWIRVYQPSNAIRTTCDPEDYPTAKYIETYREAYSNAELMTWTKDFKQPWPKNSRSAEGCPKT